MSSEREADELMMTWQQRGIGSEAGVAGGVVEAKAADRDAAASLNDDIDGRGAKRLKSVFQDLRKTRREDTSSQQRQI